MRFRKEFPLLQIAENTSYLEQQEESYTADHLRGLAILDYDGSTRPESYPDPVRHTTRRIAAVLSGIEQASAERLVLMRAVNSCNEGSKIRALRNARFAAQRRAECEAIKAALRPQGATRYQTPKHSSPCIAPLAYPFLQAGFPNPPSAWQRPQILPSHVPSQRHSTPNPSAHLATIDPYLCHHPMKPENPIELHKADLYLFKHLANSLSQIQSNKPFPYAHVKPAMNPSVPKRMSTPSTQLSTPTPSRSPTPSNPTRTLLSKHRVRRNSDQDPNATRRARGRPLGSKNRVKTSCRHGERGSGLSPEVASEEAYGKCMVVVVDGDEYVWLG